MKNILAWLHRRRGETDQSPSDKAPSKYEREVRWLSPEETPFGVDVLDCIPFARSITATTADPNIARRFGQLLGQEDLIAGTPPDIRQITCDLTYTLSEPLAEGPAFRSREMEEKWDVYFYDDQLYCVRSWTGHVWFRARLEQSDGQAHVSRIEFSLEGTVGDEEDDEYVVRIFDFLIKRHVARVMALHPLPLSKREESPQTLAHRSFVLYGVKGLYGTFADTLTTNIMTIKEFADFLGTRAT